MRISKKLFIMLATASLLAPTGAGADEIPPPETAQFVAVSVLGRITCTGETAMTEAGIDGFSGEPYVEASSILTCTGNILSLSSSASFTTIRAGIDPVASSLGECQPAHLQLCRARYNPMGKAALLTAVGQFEVVLRQGLMWDLLVGDCPGGPVGSSMDRSVTCRAGHGPTLGLPI